MAELVYAFDLKSNGILHMGSSPISGTRFSMNILYCGDKGINRGVLVSVLSILKHNKMPIHFSIMTISYENTKPFTEKSAGFLDKLVKETNSKSFVKLIDATEIFTANLPKKNMRSYFTPCSMLRLYIDKVPELNKLDRILYLD